MLAERVIQSIPRSSSHAYLGRWMSPPQNKLDSAKGSCLAHPDRVEGHGGLPRIPPALVLTFVDYGKLLTA
ncbi:hypothetical protein RB195_007115 [Necator americanus]|uniref:Uncharacterized protein n=1 Tax=Necator americanus TaxID=51031 RepID=A0ABR1BYJ9_NECAM